MTEFLKRIMTECWFQHEVGVWIRVGNKVALQCPKCMKVMPLNLE